MTNTKIPRLAMEFANELTAELGHAEAVQVAESQAAESRESICHLHDVCDANMTMFAAFCTVFMREPDLQDDDDLRAINEAWVPGREAFLSRVLH